MKTLDKIKLKRNNLSRKEIIIKADGLKRTYDNGKIKTYLHNLTSVAVHIKTQKDEADKGKEKKRKKFSIKVRVLAPTHVFESKHASDWDLARTLHKAFKNIEHEIEHKLKVSDQNLHQ